MRKLRFGVVKNLVQYHQASEVYSPELSQLSFLQNQISSLDRQTQDVPKLPCVPIIASFDSLGEQGSLSPLLVWFLPPRSYRIIAHRNYKQICDLLEQWFSNFFYFVAELHITWSLLQPHPSLPQCAPLEVLRLFRRAHTPPKTTI